MRITYFLTPLLLVAMNLAAQMPSNFVGIWKMNASKSKFSPGPPAKSVTVTITADGTVTVDGTNPDSTTSKMSYKYSEGKEVPVVDADHPTDKSTIVERIHGNITDQTWKSSEGTAKSRGVISKDGKVMTWTFDVKPPQGKPIHNVEVFERQ